MKQENIRNVAIIAHVDHGKTTLVDELFKQSGMWRENQTVSERLMDSMDLERERGITIASKNGSFEYRGCCINIIDTPGHADFGGQVERVLRMADGVLLLVDAQEGPMPQTYFVLKKALALDLPVAVVINKIDKPASRCEWVVDQVFDLFVKLGAPDHILDFPIIYASSLNGHSSVDFHNPGKDMIPLMDLIVDGIPAPNGDPEGILQLQVSTIDHSAFLGRLGIGKLVAGRLKTNQDVAVSTPDGKFVKTRITKIYRFESDAKVVIEEAVTGDIIAVAGMDTVTVGDTYTDPDDPKPLPALEIDPPTISMNFIPNDSPFAGTEGQFVTSRHLNERLQREALTDVALHVESLGAGLGFKVAGRGELHIAILIETMRREGYEFQVTRPHVIFKEIDGKQLEPYEETTIDVADEFAGAAIQMMGSRKGQMLEMNSENGMTRMKHKIPTRGLLGFRSEFMSETKGMGVLTYVFLEYDEFAGEMRNRKNGVLVSMAPCTTVAYALFNLQARGKMFLDPGINVYKGQIIGENCRPNDLAVNPAKGKQLTNVRAAGSDENVILVTPVVMSLEDCIDYINDDELVEVTPKNVRLRKLDINKKVK